MTLAYILNTDMYRTGTRAHHGKMSSNCASALVVLAALLCGGSGAEVRINRYFKPAGCDDNFRTPPVEQIHY